MRRVAGDGGAEDSALSEGGNVLYLVHGECTEITDGSDHSSLIHGAECVCRILQHQNVVLLGKLQDGIQVHRIAADMYGNDHLGLGGDLSCHVRRIHVDGSGVYVGKDQLASDGKRICHGCHKGDRRNDDLVSRLQIGILVCDLKACGGIGHKGCGLGLEVLVTSSLRRLDLRAERQLSGRGCQRIQLLDLRPNCLQSILIFLSLSLHQEANDLHQIVYVVVLTNCRPRHLGCTGIIPEIRRLLSHIHSPSILYRSLPFAKQDIVSSL